MIIEYIKSGSFEKPQPIFNEKGQMNDPEIAEEMAHKEDKMRQDEQEKYKILTKEKRKDRF